MGVGTPLLNAVNGKLIGHADTDGIDIESAFAVASDPTILDEVSEFDHLPYCFVAKLAVVPP